jgi:peptide/nickel transport system substrate-binding protein
VSALVALVIGCAPPAGDDAVVFASGADLESANPLVTIHPLARQVQRHALYVTLTRLDSTLTPQPYLARRWEWSGDRKRLTMYLYATLRWHDGFPTTARDVAFTINAARDPATGFPRAADLATVDSVVAPDDSSVVLTFNAPPPGLPPILSELPIVPEHLLKDVPRASYRRHPFAMAPVGNGPFRFVRREPGRRWLFERVDDFPDSLGGPATIRRLVIAVVDEATTKFAGLSSGDLHVAGIAPTMATLVGRDAALRVVDYPVAFATALVFNVSQPPFDDVRVRRAVDALINRQRVIDVALAGYGAPADGPVSEAHPWHERHDRLDVSTADSLLDAAGWRAAGDRQRRRGSDPLRFTLLSVGSSDNAIEQLVQADLRAHGIEVEIRQMELGAFLTIARQSPRRFDALFTGIGGDLSLSHLASMFDGRLAGGALDYANHHTPRLDSLFARARTAPTEESVADAWRAVQAELARDVPVSWIYHARGVQGLSRRLQDVRMDLRGEMATLVAWRLAPRGSGP